MDITFGFQFHAVEVITKPLREESKGNITKKIFLSKKKKLHHARLI